MSELATPIALSVAGSDPSGGAGIQADLKTFHQHRVYGMAVITLITAQNTLGVHRVDPLPADQVAAQLEAVLDDLPPQAIKVGALGSASIVEVLADALDRSEAPVILDPVLVSSSGAPLLDEEAERSLIRMLLPKTTLLTPNLPEAERLSGRSISGSEDLAEVGRALLALGPKAILIKGGHLDGRPMDILFFDQQTEEYSSVRIKTRSTHGTGCALSASIAAHLAWGRGLSESVGLAKRWLTQALRSAPGIGGGHGPLDLFAQLPTNKESGEA